MKASTHLLGSEGGYRTLAASAELTPELRSHLGSVALGETTDAAYLDSLQSRPAAFVRVLPGGRVGLSRLFRGARDDAGRQTLELRTLILHARDYEAVVRGGLAAALASTAWWLRDAFLRGEVLDLGPAPAPARRAPAEPLCLRLYDAWIQAAGAEDAAAVLPESAAADAAVLRLAALLDPKDLPEYRWGVRLLSVPPGVNAGTLSGRGPSGRRVIRADDARGFANPGVAFLAAQVPPPDRLPPAAVAARSAERATAPEAAADDAGRQAFEPALPHASAPREGGAPPVPAMPVGAWVALGAALLACGITIGIAVTRRPRTDANGGTRAPPGTPAAVAPGTPPAEGGAAAPAPPPPGGPAPVVPGAPALPPGSQGPPPRPPTAPPAEAPPETLPDAPPNAAPSAPSNTPPTAPPDPPPAPAAAATLDAAALISAMRAERDAADRSADESAAAARRLTAALAGPRDGQPWDDPPGRWSDAHCAAVLAALRDLDVAVASMPGVFLSERVQTLRRGGVEWGDAAAFAADLPTMAGAERTVAVLRRDEIANALVLRAGALTRVRRSGCDPAEIRGAVDRAALLEPRLRNLTGGAPSGRPNAVSLTEASAQVRRRVVEGVRALGAEIPAPLMEELRSIWGPFER